MRKQDDNNSLKPGVFLDRDGTINEDVGYLSEPDGLVMIDGSGRAIKKLNKSGFKVVIITNQSGVSRGFYTIDDLHSVNKRLKEYLKKDGAFVNGIYYCPHLPDEVCECRKPKTGLLKLAAAEHRIDVPSSYVVGDKFSDVLMGKTAGAKGILVMTGKGKEELESFADIQPDYIAGDLPAAVEWIVNDMNGKKTV